MENNSALLIDGYFINGLIRMSNNNGEDVPIFVSNNLDIFPQFIEKNLVNNTFQSALERGCYDDILVFKENKIFTLKEIRRVIKELKDIEEQMDAFQTADKLSK
jgi:hypothetical protein